MEDRTLCQMQFDPKLLQIRKARVERNRILAPLLVNAYSSPVRFNYSQGQGLMLQDLYEVLMGSVGQGVYDPFKLGGEK